VELQEKIDEVLECIWVKKEDLDDSIAAVKKSCGVLDADAVFSEMEKRKLIKISKDHISFTSKGEGDAKSIIRRNRLAERLLADVLSVGEESIVSAACKFEHILNPEVTESICTLLGHPPTCPHGRAIPQGECCKRAEKGLKPIVMALDQINPGDGGKIAFMAPGTHGRLDRLSALGFVPGSWISVHQKEPSFVVKIGETDIAIDPEIAKEVFVHVPRQEKGKVKKGWFGGGRRHRGS